MQPIISSLFYMCIILSNEKYVLELLLLLHMRPLGALLDKSTSGGRKRASPPILRHNIASIYETVS